MIDKCGKLSFVCWMALLSTGCFVDLGRDEAILRIFVSGASPGAEEVEVKVDDGSGLPPLTARFQLTDAVRTSTSALQPLPDISVAAGEVVVEATTFDADGAVDGPSFANLVLVDGVNGMTINFTTGDDDGGADGGVDGPTSATAVAQASMLFESIPDDENWPAVLPVEPMSWATAIGDLTSMLGETPTEVRVEHISIQAETQVGSALELDEIWDSSVSVRLDGGTVGVSVGPVPVAGLTSAQTPDIDVDVQSWVGSLPMNAQVTVTGEIDGDDLERVVIRARLQVVGIKP